MRDKELNISKYLLKNKKKLMDRYCVREGNKEWFELHDPVSPQYFLSKKIMFPDISLVPSFSIDLEGEFFSLDTNYSVIPKDENWLFYLLGILNSFIMEIYYRFKFQTLAKEFRFKTFLVNNIPIINPESVKPHMFLQICELSRKLYEDYSLELEKELNYIFKQLYELDEQEYNYVIEIANKYHNVENF
ncbi:MAG: TaqI-like C-terminal specificity domain-containing protein [Candidatus Hermodarchaeota archaeon]